MSKRREKIGRETDEQRRFAQLCLAESYRVGTQADSIGIYQEKRLHGILKRLVCDSESTHEVRLGRYVADVVSDGVISEIQTKNLGRLRAKLEYYLENTEYSIVIIHPIIKNRRIIRADRESGEIKSNKLSPKHENVHDALARLYPIADLLSNERVRTRIMHVEVEEYRYSERMRYRRQGAFDSDVFPTCLTDISELCELGDFAKYIPDELCVNAFSANDFFPYTTLRGRDVYSMLNTLSAVGVLERTKEKGSVIYRAK